jgi:signal peptidase I
LIRAALLLSAAALAAVVLALALVAFFVYAKLYKIPSAAMEPTIKCEAPAPGCTGKTADRVVAFRLRWPFSGVGRGDVVVFRTPPAARRKCGVSGVLVKRVIGLPGERVAERRGLILVNGRRLDEPYVERDRRDRGSYRPHRVPDHAYFVLGDARTQSCDSRIWGMLPRRDLVGKVVATYWPPTRISFR